MLEELKDAVLEANLELPRRNLVIYDWGNVSGVDRDKGMIVIKPSGIPYKKMKKEHLVVVDFNGKVIEGTCKPSVDTKTHLVLYQSFTNIGGITHTHSQWATIWAQACRSIPCFGTTHADDFYGEIPCTEKFTREQIESDYEQETGNAIVERFKALNPDYMPGVLVASHGPFTWGKDSFEAVHNSVVLEVIAKMALGTLTLIPEASPISSYLLDKHFFRKHGPNAYFGQ